MKYIVSYSQPHNHYIDIEFIIDNVNENELTIQLPAWRPGRYELGNFAKNIQKWAAFDTKGNSLVANKTTKDTWKVDTQHTTSVRIKYNFFANDLNAGSTFVNEHQLYMNPVNCCLYVPERMSESCELEIHTPKNYTLAIGVPSTNKNGVHTCTFDNFHALADNPYIASDSLKHKTYNCNGITFNLWIQGECRPDWNKLTKDFAKFSQLQLDTMKGFPSKAFHFLIHLMPHRAYHGVEHTTSTVILLGPGYNLMSGKTYEDLLGVCSHELFHVWNVKTIRPTEMFPYDYSKENYSKLGYVCEGVTTYYGDYFLFKSNVFNESEYLKTLNERIQNHFDNFGRFNRSVAESSYDSWLDGYERGVPHRKTSIYSEGCLLAFATDMFIRKHSKNNFCLDDVMRHLYHEFALKNKGYSDLDYKKTVEKFAGTSYDTIFSNYINTATDYTELLNEAMDYIGCKLTCSASSKSHEGKLGIKIADSSGTCKISAVAPKSNADNAGISIGDHIVAINNIQVLPDSSGTNFSEWCNYFTHEATELTLTLASSKQLKTVTVQLNENPKYGVVSMEKSKKATATQQENFRIWSNNKF